MLLPKVFMAPPAKDPAEDTAFETLGARASETLPRTQFVAILKRILIPFQSSPWVPPSLVQVSAVFALGCHPFVKRRRLFLSFSINL